MDYSPHGAQYREIMMPEAFDTLFESTPSRHWIKLRTLITLRWVAVAGQIIAIFIAETFFDLAIELGACAVAIGLSIIANIVSISIYPQNKRLSEREAVMMLLFDTAQVSALIFLTGGLNNPFAMLIAAPVTVAATALSLRATLLVGASAIAVTSLLTNTFTPLTTNAGTVLSMPDVFVFGLWVAIVTLITFTAAFNRRVSSETQSMSQALLAAQMALAREQKLTDLGGVIAAAAHELGTPLATIKLVSSEMARELDDGSEMFEDAVLIREQADRCRDILHSMGRAGKDDVHVHQAPLEAVISEAAEPHQNRGKHVTVTMRPAPGLSGEQPTVLRRPELINGLRNLSQNAVDFAATSVWIEAVWDEARIRVRIIDDGSGYPPHLLGKIGDPFIRKRRSARDARRPEYEGMGLGLFIAKTLLERTGALLDFVNGRETYTGTAIEGKKLGAIVVVEWRRNAEGLEADHRLPALDNNAQFKV